MTNFLISFLVTIIYIIIIIPVSTALRVINKKTIPLDFEVSKESYWVVKKQIRLKNNHVK